MTSSVGGEALCQACNLLAGLEAGKPKIGLSMGPSEAAAGSSSDEEVSATAGAGATTAMPTRTVKFMLSTLGGAGGDISGSF